MKRYLATGAATLGIATVAALGFAGPAAAAPREVGTPPTPSANCETRATPCKSKSKTAHGMSRCPSAQLTT